MHLNSIRYFLMIILLSFPWNAWAYTCEEEHMHMLNNNMLGCLGYGVCGEDGVTIGRDRFSTEIKNGNLYLYCYYKVCSAEETTRSVVGVVSPCSGSVLPEAKALKFEMPHTKKICGSIIDIENQTLGEKLPITGASFSLKYFSHWTEGVVDRYTLSVPLSKSIIRDTINSFDIGVSSENTIVDTAFFLNDTVDQAYTYIWDGKDDLGKPTIASKIFKVSVKENRIGYDFPPIETTVALGSLKSRLFGLGGWLPSIFAFYDIEGQTLYKGDGSLRVVTAKKSGIELHIAEYDGSLVYIFDSKGFLQKIKSGFLGSILYEFNYDSFGNILSIVEPFGRVTSFSRNTIGELVSIVSPKGQMTTVTLDVNGYLKTFSNDLGETFEMTYGLKGLLLRFARPNGQFNSYSYNIQGQLSKNENSGGYFVELVNLISNEDKIKTRYTTAEGRINESEVLRTDSKIVRTEQLAMGVEEEVEHSSFNYFPENNEYLLRKSKGVQTLQVNLAHLQFPETAFYKSSENIALDYVGSRNVDYIPSISLSDPSDPFSILSWELEIKMNGNIVPILSMSFDPNNKKFLSTTGMGKTSEVQIDAYERVISLKRGHTDTIYINYENELLKSISQGSRAYYFGYNISSGFLESIKNSKNEITIFTRDSIGRVRFEILPDLRTIEYIYDANSNLIGINLPNGRSHVFGLTNSELISHYNAPLISGVLSTTTNYFYNLDRQLTRISRPDGKNLDFIYDPTTGFLDAIETADGNVDQFKNSLNGLPSRIIGAGRAPTLISFVGDVLAGSSVEDMGSNFIWAYDSYLTSGLRFGSDLVSSSSQQSSIVYDYNSDEELIKAGDLILDYDTPNGHLIGSTIGTAPNNIDDSYTYNSYGEVVGYSVNYGGSPVYELTLARDLLGRVVEKNQSMNSTSKIYEYDFDNSGRLTQIQLNSSIVSSYSYDSNSNRTGGSVYGTATTGVYDAQDRLNSYNVYDFTYNANGELQQKTNTLLSTSISYVYDVFGNLKEVTLPSADVISYEVDGLNRRIGKKLNGVLQKRWVYMDQLRIAGELDASGNISKRFVYASKQNIPDYMIYGGENYRIISDHLGSLRLVIKVSDGTIVQRMDHDEFGRVIEDTNAGFLPFGFAGGLYDHQTGLVRFGARDYDPETGRWTSKDPILFNGGQSNLYGYTFNDPVNFIDPSGKFGVAGVASGFISGMVGGYISGGTIPAALAGGAAGAVVGFLNPFASSAAGAFAGGVTSSLAGQVFGNVLTDQPYMNLNLGAAVFSGFGSAVGVQAAGAMACGRTGAAVVEGGASGFAEVFGGTLDQTRNYSPLFSPMIR